MGKGRRARAKRARKKRRNNSKLSLLLRELELIRTLPVAAVSAATFEMSLPLTVEDIEELERNHGQR
jgi:hypothetical protein